MPHYAHFGLEVVGWSTYKRGDPQLGWIAVGEATPAGYHIRIRRGLAHLPFIGRRIIRHEIEHGACADFRSNDDHHDSEAWASRAGAAPHHCGRSHSWRGVFSTKHLRLHPKHADLLVKEGHAPIPCEPGSLGRPIARQP